MSGPDRTRNRSLPVTGQVAGPRDNGGHRNAREASPGGPGPAGKARSVVSTRLPSAGFSITVRVAVPADASSIGLLTTAVGASGGIVTGLDVVDSDPSRMVVDLTCDAADSGHAEQVVNDLKAVAGVEVRKISDRTFLRHLGGKIEVASKVSLRTRDDLSRAYTPGVARVCLAIAENPEDARRLTEPAAR